MMEKGISVFIPTFEVWWRAWLLLYPMSLNGLLKVIATAKRHRQIRLHSFVTSRSILTPEVPVPPPPPPFFPPPSSFSHPFTTMPLPSVLPCLTSTWSILLPSAVCTLRPLLFLIASFSLSSSIISNFFSSLALLFLISPSFYCCEVQCLTRMNGSYLSCWQVQQGPVCVFGGTGVGWGGVV